MFNSAIIQCGDRCKPMGRKRAIKPEPPTVKVETAEVEPEPTEEELFVDTSEIVTETTEESKEAKESFSQVGKLKFVVVNGKKLVIVSRGQGSERLPPNFQVSDVEAKSTCVRLKEILKSAMKKVPFGGLADLYRQVDQRHQELIARGNSTQSDDIMELMGL